jgi:hypothetical protein
MILSSHGIIGSSIVQFSPQIAADAFYGRVTAAGGSLTATEESAILDLITDLIDYELWDKMKAIYPMVGASAAACAQNLKSSSFTGTFTVTGWTFASTGVKPNGSSAFMNTGLIPDNSLTINNTHLCVYSRTNSSGGFVDIGTNDNATTFLPLFKMYLRNGSNLWDSTQYSFELGQLLSVANTDSRGSFLISRTSISSSKAYKNGALSLTALNNNNQTRMSKFSLYVGASHNNGLPNEYSNREYAFCSIGDGLTDTEASDFYDAVQAFQETLNREV